MISEAQAKWLVDEMIRTRREFGLWKKRLEQCEDAYESHICQMMFEDSLYAAMSAKIALNSAY